MMTPRPKQQLELPERNVVSNRVYVISEATATTPWKSPYGSLNRRADFHLEDFI
jgi:hypothetical protein